MGHDIESWLSDILKAIAEIEEFLPKPYNFIEFQQDLKTRRAIERNISIIGEAVNRILKIHPDIEISHARKIVDTRNRIMHGYDSVSEDILWAIVVKSLPQLKTDIVKLKTND
ncbi:MAG: HepT-like ribonuclease domain-containing protein [Chitinophagales bacterium]|nr:HepT-like ribonuclease domain-containing protein [Chitinophagales bacterium]